MERSLEALEESRRLAAHADRLIAEVKQKIAYLDWFIDSLRRVCEPDFFRPLQEAIRVMHHCESSHVKSFVVRKVRDGQTVWAGVVEEFALIDHPGATACYAWHYGEGNRAESFSVLKQPPIDSAQRAVQFFCWQRKSRNRAP